MAHASKDEIEADRLAAVEECKINCSLDPATFPAGTYGFHEAFHTASVAEDIVSRHLLEHPAVINSPDLYAIAYRAHEALFNLYQAMGDMIPEGQWEQEQSIVDASASRPAPSPAGTKGPKRPSKGKKG